MTSTTAAVDPAGLRMNVAALKRVDPYAKDILETATHVALYTFNGESNEWEKTEIEGALFVYSRIGEPYNSFIIMNRLSTSNQVEPVTSALDLQLQEPFLLYRNAQNQIYGIWFYEKEECVSISVILSKLAKESDKDSNKSTSKNKRTVQKKPNNVDIFSMLSKAQEDFNINKGNSVDKGPRGMEVKSPMSNAIGELSGALNAMAMAPDVTSKSVMDFFAKAKVNTGHYKASDQVPACNTACNEGKPLLARLMSHPAAHTVEHIEKQQRSITPQPTAPAQLGVMMSMRSQICENSAPSQVAKMIPMRNQSCEDSIIAKLQKKVPAKPGVSTPGSGHPFGQDYPTALNSSACSAVSSIMNMEESNNTSSFLRIQSPTANNLSNNVMNQHKNASNYVDPFDKLFRESTPTTMEEFLNSTGCDDHLMPPLMSKGGNDTAPALIPPGMFAAPSPAAEPLNRPIEPLTRNQLLQAFNYLLRTDPEFVNKLHEAYVKSFSEILS